MFIERNKNLIKRRQQFWFALLLSRQPDLSLTGEKNPTISLQKNLFNSKAMKCHCWENAEEIAQDSLGMACASSGPRWPFPFSSITAVLMEGSRNPDIGVRGGSSHCS